MVVITIFTTLWESMFFKFPSISSESKMMVPLSWHHYWSIDSGQEVQNMTTCCWILSQEVYMIYKNPLFQPSPTCWEYVTLHETTLSREKWMVGWWCISFWDAISFRGYVSFRELLYIHYVPSMKATTNARWTIRNPGETTFRITSSEGGLVETSQASLLKFVCYSYPG